jgi:hypothetical protein
MIDMYLYVTKNMVRCSAHPQSSHLAPYSVPTRANTDRAARELFGDPCHTQASFLRQREKQMNSWAVINK